MSALHCAVHGACEHGVDHCNTSEWCDPCEDRVNAMGDQRLCELTSPTPVLHTPSPATDPCPHCHGTGRVPHCDHDWRSYPARGVRICSLCGRPEDLPNRPLTLVDNP